MNVSGLLIVKDEEWLAPLAIRSVSHVCDYIRVVDNGSSDDTIPNIKSELDDIGIDADIEIDHRYVGHIFHEVAEELSGFVFRIESDQIFFRDRIADAVSRAEPQKTVNCRSIMLRNRFDLQNDEYPLNAPHPTIYDAESGLIHPEGKLWPRGDYRRTESIQTPVCVNCRVGYPEERIKRWHRACWWRWGGRDIPENMTLPDLTPPYQDHISLEEYIWRLRELGKGSIQWGGDSLEEIGRNYIEWDIEQNCQPYEGEYPSILKEFIEEHGFRGPF